MTQQPFHHGNLRAVLLERAEQTLREGSIDDLSLRQLARQAGVSHGAPRSHFVDRRALLDAVAERGFLRLIEEVTRAGDEYPKNLTARLRGVATAYVRFAVTDATLLELMFSTKNADAPEGVQAAARRLFSTFDSMFDADFRAGHLRGSDLQQSKLLFVAMLQGVAALIISGRIDEQSGTAVISDAVDLLVDQVLVEEAIG